MNSKLSTDGGDKPRVRLVPIGGFLGVGKSTAAVQLARFLKKRGKLAGIITNDHGTELVDSTLFRAQGIPTESLQGGPFGGRHDEFAAVATRMMEEENMDVVIAEPIGTCTGFARDFLEPLRHSRSGKFTFAPLSMMIDPRRAREILESDRPSIAGDQLDEADLLVINKADQFPARELTELRIELGQRFPSAHIFVVSAADGAGLEEWFECLMSKDWVPGPVLREPSSGAGASPESSISWLNCTVLLSSVRYFEAGRLLIDLATCVQSLLKQEGGEMAHLKMVFKSGHDPSDIASVSLVAHENAPKLLREVSEPVQRGELFLSARAEADPEILHTVLNRALMALMERSSELFARMQHCEHFKPGRTKTRQPPSLAAARE